MDNKKQGSPQQTFLMLECGSLDLQTIIQKALVMIGNTKAGKTTSGHYMIGSELVGIKNNANNTIYGLKTGKNISKIGQHESDSQTQIPNFFNFKLSKQIVGIDCPGFLDSFGCLRIISNVYFIQKVLSIVKQIKFVIVLKFLHLRGAANGLKSTFISFLNMLQDADYIIDKILPSISLLITEVPRELDQNILQQKYRLTPNSIVSKYDQAYGKIKKQLLQKHRIFMIKQAQLGKASDVENKLASQINGGSKFWVRSINQYGKVSTQDFRLTINQYMERDNELFNKELSSFSQYFNQKLTKNLKILLCIFQQIISSAETDEPLNCMDKINDYLEAKQNDIHKLDKEYEDLYANYGEKRKIAIDRLFRNPDKEFANEFSINQVNNKDIPFSFMKMKAIKKLSKITQTVLQLQKDRQLTTTKIQIQQIGEMLKILIILSKRNNADDQQNLLRFCYQIYKQNQLMNQIYEVFMNSADEKGEKGKNNLAKKQMQFIYYQWPERLRRIFHLFSKGRSSYKIIIEYIENLNAKTKYNNPKIYTYFINFINSVKFILQSSHNTKMLQNYQISKQQLKLAIKIFDRKLQALNFKLLQYSTYESLSQHDKIIINIENQRQNVMGSILREENDPRDSDEEQIYDENLVCNLQMSQLVGYCVQKIDKVTATQIYECLGDAYQVLQVYKMRQVKLIEKFNHKSEQGKIQMMNFCFQYAKKAYVYNRAQLAIQKGQKAYSFAQKLGDKDAMKNIGKFLYKIYPNMYNKDATNDEEQEEQDQKLDIIKQERIKHAEAMNNGFFKADFSQELVGRLKNLKQSEPNHIGKSPTYSNSSKAIMSPQKKQ